jgi:PBP1b-binding outer membrane lipoprotein LpoB
MKRIIFIITIILVISIFSSCVSNKQSTPNLVINETPNMTPNITNISTSDITNKHFPYKPPLTPVPTINIKNITNIINQDIANNQSNRRN